MIRLLLLLIPFILNANIKYQNFNYVKYLQGTLPIIISVPHGGTLEPENIPNRTYGKKGRDKYTDLLAKDIALEFYKQADKYPYIIILELARKKLDANREIQEAAQGNKEATKIYNTFHFAIQTSIEEVNKKFKQGLYIDLHGHSHPNNYIEFGYLLSNDILKLSNKEIETFKELSSIKNLSNSSKENFVQQIKGKNSLSGLMATKGYKSIPSFDIPYALDDKYFKGAFSTKQYGSYYGGNINSIQVEFPRTGFRDTEQNRQKLAKDFVDSIIKFMKIHYHLSLKK
jgi:N-formylglutamate amidohydrolase